MIRKHGWFSVGMFCASFWFLAPSVQADAVPSGIVPLVSRLVDHYPHMLDAGQRAQFDRLNRRLRELEHRLRHDSDADK